MRYDIFSLFEMNNKETNLTKKNEGISIRSGPAEYLTYVASIGEREDNLEMHYEDENIWLTQSLFYPFCKSLRF